MVCNDGQGRYTGRLVRGALNYYDAMERMRFIVPGYGWSVEVFMPARSLNVSEIMAAMNRIGASYTNKRTAYEAMMREEFNCGLTVSNNNSRASVMVVGVASSAMEFYDSLRHEETHLAMHIAEACKIDERSEEFAYLVGDIGRVIFPTAKKYLCDHCRSK